MLNLLVTRVLSGVLLHYLKTPVKLRYKKIKGSISICTMAQPSVQRKIHSGDPEKIARSVEAT